jgi:mannose-6-phosphate isomerase-like protein (cupin superfamily)
MTRTETPLPMNVIAPDAGRAWWWFGQLANVKAGADETHGRYTLVEILAPPHYATPLHRHHREDEAFWVLEGGETTFEVGGETVEGPPGTYLVAPRGYRTQCASGRPARRATIAAIGHCAHGIYTLADDVRAAVAEWVPELARALGAKPPRHVPARIGVWSAARSACR